MENWPPILLVQYLLFFILFYKYYVNHTYNFQMCFCSLAFANSGEYMGFTTYPPPYLNQQEGECK